ncbi:transposase [Ureibacillus thermosphaericus]|uniref:transposase n=1 Tax=Ureibacillus thermosphaericus TaxID=51173 RepID=UPI0018D53C5D|nr:transposase [Ureibacillus thermosphaericus]
MEDRRLHVLKEYFLRYSKKARDAVKTIVIDMYSPYISLIQEVFPKAEIILDKFHILQLFSRALNKTRINVMNRDKKNYNKLKKILEAPLSYINTCNIASKSKTLSS